MGIRDIDPACLLGRSVHSPVRILLRLRAVKHHSVRLGLRGFLLSAGAEGRLAGKGSSVRHRALVLCPLFLPVAVSYMTDVPCLFFLFASLYALTRAAEASREGRGYGWLALGVILGFLGGTGRQVA